MNNNAFCVEKYNKNFNQKSNVLIIGQAVRVLPAVRVLGQATGLGTSQAWLPEYSDCGEYSSVDHVQREEEEVPSAAVVTTTPKPEPTHEYKSSHPKSEPAHEYKR